MTIVILQRLEILGIDSTERLGNALDQLPETGFHVIALPMKIKGGSGGPVRVIALVPR